MEGFDTIEYVIDYHDKLEDEPGCFVVWASDAEEALRKFRREHPPLYFEILGIEAS